MVNTCKMHNVIVILAHLTFHIKAFGILIDICNCSEIIEHMILYYIYECCQRYDLNPN